MAVATYDKKPAFLRKELDKILRDTPHKRGSKAEREIPVVRITGEGRVKVISASSRGPGHKR